MHNEIMARRQLKTSCSLYKPLASAPPSPELEEIMGIRSDKNIKYKYIQIQNQHKTKKKVQDTYTSQN